MSDEISVEIAIFDLSPGEVISHGVARTIASWMNDHNTVRFVSTGYMYASADEMMDDFTRGMDQATVTDLSLELNALEDYLVSREFSGSTGKVVDWHLKWVQ